MYIGRIVAIGMNPQKKVTAMYRVSSRSFPNRKAWKKADNMVAIMPRAGYEEDLTRNPYIAYNCLRVVGNCAIAANGSHTDPIAEKIELGMSIRDAISLSLLAMDYEKDSYNTPRIVAAVDREINKGFLGIIRHDALLVREMELTPGTAYFVATYEINEPRAENLDAAFDAETANACCQHVISGGRFAEFEKPVTATAALSSDDGFDIATAIAE